MTKWKNTINIKHLFNEDESKEYVKGICTNIISQLKLIQPNIEEESFFSDELDEMIYLFEDIVEAKEVDCYLGKTWCEWFNYRLGELYDLGDAYIAPNEKFLWIN